MSLLTPLAPGFEVTDEVKDIAGQFIELGRNISTDPHQLARESVAIQAAVWFALAVIDAGLLNGTVVIGDEGVL